MRVKLNPDLSPRKVSELPPEMAKHVVHHDKLKVTPGSRLRLELVVVDKPRWIGKVADFLSNSPVRTGRCFGVVYPQSRVAESYKDGPVPRLWQEYAPNVFSVMVLSRDHLTMAYLVHEAVHAATNFAERVPVRKLPWAKMCVDDPSEEVAYPAGRIGAEVLWSLRKAGLCG